MGIWHGISSKLVSDLKFIKVRRHYYFLKWFFQKGGVFGVERVAFFQRCGMPGGWFSMPDFEILRRKKTVRAEII
jgi:hypothetical protein